MAPLTSILEITIPLKRSTLERQEVGDDEFDEFTISENGVKHAKRLGKIVSIRKMKRR